MKKLSGTLKFPILSWAIWLVVIFCFISFFSRTIPLNPTFPYFLSDLSKYPRALSTYAFFDGIHYLRIARYGYLDTGTQAFFPVYPMIIRAFSTILDPLVAGVMISAISTLLSLITLWKILPKKIAKLTILIILAFPTSFYLTSVYTEGLFLLEITLWLQAVKGKRLGRAALISGIASATRIAGIGLSLATIYLLLKRSKRTKSLLLSVLSLSGLISYMTYLSSKFSDALMFLHVQPLFGAERSGGKLILLPQVIWRYLKILFTADPTTLLYARSLLELVITLGALVLLYKVWKTRPIHETLLASTLILLPTLTGTLSSMPRYALLAIPIFIVLSESINTRVPKLFILAFLIVQVILLTIFTSGGFVS